RYLKQKTQSVAFTRQLLLRGQRVLIFERIVHRHRHLIGDQVQEINLPAVVGARLLAAETNGPETTSRCRQRQNAEAIHTEPWRPLVIIRPPFCLACERSDHW